MRQRKDLEKQEIEETNRFVACLFPDEKSKDSFSEKELNDISKISGVNEKIIHHMIMNFRYNFKLHEYLRNKAKKKETLPESQLEMNKDIEENHFEISNYLREKMISEIIKKLNYTEEYVEQKENEIARKKLMKSKRTYSY
jgi:hypothetical protein